MTVAYICTYTNKKEAETQKKVIEKFSKEKKLKIDKWIKEENDSSKEIDQLEDLIKSMEKGDILIITDITRLSWKLMPAIHLISLCIGKGVALYSIKDDFMFEDNESSKTQAFAFSLVSEIESTLASTRAKDASDTSRDRGVKIGRPSGSLIDEYLLPKKSEIEKKLREENTTYPKLAEFYNVNPSSLKHFVQVHIPDLPPRRKRKEKSE